MGQALVADEERKDFILQVAPACGAMSENSAYPGDGQPFFLQVAHERGASGHQFKASGHQFEKSGKQFADSIRARGLEEVNAAQAVALSRCKAGTVKRMDEVSCLLYTSPSPRDS